MAEQAAKDNHSPDADQAEAEGADPSTSPETGDGHNPSATPLPKTHPARLAAMASPAPSETPDQHKHPAVTTMNRVAPRQQSDELGRWTPELSAVWNEQTPGKLSWVSRGLSFVTDSRSLSPQLADWNPF
jgi:hypothetical protein